MREMKDSGVPWIGEIPKGWSLRRIGQMYKERRTKVSDIDFNPLSVTMKGVVPQLSTAAKTDAHDDRKLVKKGDFAINSRSDRRGSCGIAPQDGSVSLINTILCPLNETNSAYLNWLFHSTLFADEFYRWGHGIVDDLWTTNWSDMKRIYIPYPSLSEQQHIADFLDTKCAEIDSILEQTKASIEEYKKLKQSVITEAVTKGIRGNRPMKYSGVEWIGEIPAEWRVCKMKHAISVLAGYAFSSDSFTDQGVRLLRGINVTPQGLRWEETVYWNQSIDSSIEPYQLRAGDLVLGLDRPWIKEGTRVTFVNETDLPCLLLQRVCRIRPRKTSDIRFVFWVIASNLFEEALTTDTTGISIPHISTGQLEAFLFALPSFSEQQEIAAYLDEKCAAIDSLIASKEALITELEAYKKSLIYEYVTGKKEVV